MPTPAIHRFSSTGEAYDSSQTHSTIIDGDILSVPSERVVGVLVEAWPIAVGENSGEFHPLDYRCDWDAMPTTASNYTETKDYSESFKIAAEELNRVLMEVAQELWHKEAVKISESYKRETE